MSESSFDGSLNQSDSVNYATWASTSSPGEEDPVSPIKGKKDIHQEGDSTTNPKSEVIPSDPTKTTQDSLQDSLEDARLSLPPLHFVLKLTLYLSNQGFSIPALQDMDINSDDQTISVELVDTWAQSILTAVGELSDRITQQRHTVSSVSSEYRAQSASKEALLSRISDLQALVLDLEKREKTLQNKLLEQGRYMNTCIYKYTYKYTYTYRETAG
ncbi:hypothetical protein EON65_51540 [archaeon]|nr:MAG: hypothetical protein EON65_51540 [archaeon]